MIGSMFSGIGGLDLACEWALLSNHTNIVVANDGELVHTCEGNASNAVDSKHRFKSERREQKE